MNIDTSIMAATIITRTLIVMKILIKSLLVFATTSLLIACGADSSDTSSPDGSEQSPASSKTRLDSLVQTKNLLVTQTDSCPNGGVQVEMGIDANGNSRLDPDEVDHGRTQTVCHGLDGQDGIASGLTIIDATDAECAAGGKKILIGQDLDNSGTLDVAEATQTELMCNLVITAPARGDVLIATQAESRGVNCSDGGIRFDIGLDKNANAILSADEIQTSNYICYGRDGLNGEGGADGVDGKDGADGLNGTDGKDGADGVSNFDALLIEVADESFGENCFHGGKKHQVGLDNNLDGSLQAEEVISASFLCNPNSAPEISFSEPQLPISGVRYSLMVHSSDYDDIFEDAVEITVLEKPEWLTAVDATDNSLRLEGVPTGNAGDTYTLKVSSTDTDLTTEQDFQITLVEGIHLSITAADVVEGNFEGPGQPSVTQGEFVLTLSQPATQEMRVSYALNGASSLNNQDWRAVDPSVPYSYDPYYSGSSSYYPSGSVRFDAGEIEKVIPVWIIGDNDYEWVEALSVHITNVEYQGTEYTSYQGYQYLLITNDDPVVTLELTSLIDNAAEMFEVYLGQYGEYYPLPKTELKNQPEWMSYSTVSKDYQCSPYGYACYQTLGAVLTGIPPVETIGQTASVDVEFTLAGQRLVKSLNYIITDGDADNDGALNSADAFPLNPEYQQDSDNDGLADGWELAYLGDLSAADAESDYDGDGQSDAEAFQAGDSPALDSDGDKRIDALDAFPNHAGYQYDADGDGLPDQWEYQHAGDLNSMAATTDQDGDGMSDLAEFEQDTNPTNTDTDGDGINDANDAFPNNSAYQADSDNDGLADEWEQSYFADLTVTDGSLDSDSDGQTDQEEFNQGSLPVADSDNDGVADTHDAFPNNPRGQTDSDSDGLGDEWEILNFDSLELADSTSDYDNNGVTDLSAFENSTPINDLTFDFESGELPEGWVNTGDVDWVVSDAHSYRGQYALTIAQPLAPGERARIEFEFSSQKGRLRLYSRAESDGTDSATFYLGDDYLGMPNTYWSSDTDSYSAGTHKRSLTYRNSSSTHNAPIIYVDFLSGLKGLIPADRDGDGVLNNDDLFPDRPDASTDTDGDGIGDEWEMQYFGTLDRVSATSDFDNDGLLDLAEFEHTANPTSSNSDNDGVSDGDDAFPGDSRYQADSDNDGLADRWELDHFAALNISDGSQDSDNDGITDLAEFMAGTPPTPDSDGDGSADVVDAFPDNAQYQNDNDNDGIADEWENRYGHTGRFSADGDYDSDGRTDLKEFLEGTDPTKKNLNAVADIFSMIKGQALSFNPAENDISLQANITTTSVALPEGTQASWGTVQDNGDGSYTYTADNDKLGWLRLSYQASDGESTAEGEVFIHIVEQAPAQVVKIDGASNGYDSYFSMALFDDGSLYSWGDNDRGQLGLGTTLDNPVPTKVGGLPAIKDFALGDDYSLALAEDGSVWKWGNGSTAPTVLSGVSGIQAVAATGHSNSGYYLLKQDGTVLRSSSTASGLNNIKDIKAGRHHLLALSHDGTVWAKAEGSHNVYNSSGQLGNGTFTGSTTPIQVSKLSNIVAIEAANDQSFAIDADGQLFAWGGNDYGQLGDGTRINRNVPVLVEGLTSVAEVSVGYNHTLVRTTSGELYGMGYGYSGALGENNNSSRITTPRKVTHQPVASIGTGYESSFFIGTDGLSYSFGRNSRGQLGDGTTDRHSQPQEISWLLDGVISELGKEGFEWGRIPPYWRNSGNNWQVVSSANAGNVASGSFAVKVRERLNDSASASLGLQIETGAGEVSFKVKTSTEADYDKLVFYVDGVEKASFSGDNDWADSTAITVTAGIHSFEWIYHKDGGTSVGDDTVWLDDILLPVDSDGDGIIDSQDVEPYVVNAPEPEPAP